MKGNWLFILCLSALAVSCSKNSGPADLPSIQPDNRLDTLISMTAAIGHFNFATTSAYGYNVATTSGVSNLHNLLITGSEHAHDTSVSISISINGYGGPDTYKINPPYVTATYYIDNQRHYATWGNVVIARDSNYAMIGTFQFLADSLIVENGNFNVLAPF